MNRVPTVIICAPNSYIGHAVESALTGVGARCVYYASAMDMLRRLDTGVERFDYVVVEDTGYGLAKTSILGEMVNHLAPSAHVFLLSAAPGRPHGFDETRLNVIDLKTPASDICRALTGRVSNELRQYSRSLLVA